MEFHTPYNIDDPVKHSNATGLKCTDRTLAKQEFRDECNINILFARYLETGEMPQVQQGISYGNFEGIFDFQTAMNAVRTAEGLFTQLPARIKNRFDNDPQKLLEFLGNAENREEAEFLGLIDKPKGATDGQQGTLPAATDAQAKAGDTGAAGAADTGKTT